MPMTPDTAFAALLLAFVSWMAIPFLPAIAEFVRPRDAAPLDAVGSDAGDLRYLATSFASRAQAEGLLSAAVPTALANGTIVRSHTATAPLPAREAVRDLVVCVDDTPIPAGATLASECVAQRSLRGGDAVTYRALLGQFDVVLGPRSTVHRWVHAGGRLQVGAGSRLLGRGTADREIVLAADVSFDRLDAPVVRVAGVATPDTLILPLAAFESWEPDSAIRLGPGYFRVEGDVVIPAGTALAGSLIATGSVHVSDGARVEGAIKAHGALLVGRRAVVVGAITSRARVTVEAGAVVIGPVISETAAEIGAAIIGRPNQRTTVTAPVIHLSRGALIHGAVMAADTGDTIA